ncbi:MAG TPA: hypothetical protein DDZ80_00545 [Cyanobacteria bacterium UBA8803]|nr:hypothetical protein [Cyanobacteria bacterium UBA8803]
MTINYRLFFNNTPATREQIDRVEEITVEQEIDMAWEARMQVPIATDDRGNWTGEDEDFLREFTQVRVEIQVGDGVFVPLIDGPIVEDGDRMSSEPGQSMKTVVVQDDSVRLNQEDRIFRFDNLLDHEIASQVFGEVEAIASTEIEDTPAPSSSLSPVVVQRGTAMQFLRSLSRRQGMHAYVLPGTEPGQSIGCFKAFPTQPDGLPPLILLGAERNVAEFTPTNNAQRPARVTGYTLNIADKTVTQRTSDFGRLDLLGEETTFADEGNAATQILSPRYGDAVDLDQAVAAEALRSSYSTEATGRVLNDTYPAILSPYRVVSVWGANQRRSGNYLIRQVTHSLTRSYYSQTFTLQRNARSSGSSAGLANLAESII